MASLGAVALLVPGWMGEDPVVWSLLAIVVISTAPALARSAGGGALRFAKVAGRSIAIVAAYIAWHAVFDRLVAAQSGPRELAPLRIGIVAAAFSLLFVVNAVVEARPSGGFARALYPLLFAGFHLDEIFTRLTFRIWPARAMAVPSAPRTISLRSHPQEESRP
jgi:NAD(P)H-quinone oxidoreductase subunit 5